MCTLGTPRASSHENTEGVLAPLAQYAWCPHTPEIIALHLLIIQVSHQQTAPDLQEKRDPSTYLGVLGPTLESILKCKWRLNELLKLAVLPKFS